LPPGCSCSASATPEHRAGPRPSWRHQRVEHGTRIADAAGGLSDEAWASAAEHHDDEQPGALVALIAFINAANRVNVISRQPAGEYQAGQFANMTAELRA
jgi:hypothetical protein